MQSEQFPSGCREEAASIVRVVGFQLTPEHNEYDIISWRVDGMTARYVGGVCKIAHTLEIDFKTGSVLITDSPTKMNAKLSSCPTETSSYQLMDGESFMINIKKESSETSSIRSVYDLRRAQHLQSVRQRQGPFRFLCERYSHG